jgi:16S rRNA (cytosine967-C5)-methyltransferase
MAPPPRQNRSRASVDAPRRAAFDALLAVSASDSYLNLVLPDLLTERGIVDRDAAFATELTNGTARLQGTYDAIIDSVVTAGASSLQPAVRIALRLGAHQLLDMRVPPHAAVTTSVELVRDAVGERPVRLANAVLRKVAGTTRRDWLSRVAPPVADDAIGHLVVTHSHPRWIVQAFADALGGDLGQVAELLEADNLAPLVTLALRPGLVSVEELLSTGAVPARWSPYAAVLPRGDPGGMPLVRSGRAGVQDEGSQLAALALARAAVDGPDARWLDMCAGPGGKAALLTGLARQRGATLVAAERLEHRARLVRSGLRAYPPPRPIVVADANRPPWTSGGFDRVLVDAPCTGLGALRRRPEARWRRLPGDVDDLVRLQRRLLTSALDATRPGGVVAYVTCSPHLAETRGVVDAVIRARGDVGEQDARTLLSEVGDLGDGPHVQLWPHLHGTDAMFVAVLRRLAH